MTPDFAPRDTSSPTVEPARLACSVRGCGLPLAREGRTWRCGTGHTFDIARSGYVNLLQPQDRRSRQAGDARMIVARRARLWEAGVGRALLQAVAAATTSTHAKTGQTSAVELGSGCGDVLAALCRDRGWRGIGIDLSTAAVDYAARRFPDVTWVAANADRSLPLVDGCADVVLSLNARRNPAECARILRAHGRLVVAVPAPDDLAELRAAAQGDGRERSRAETLIAEHAACFDVESRGQVREQDWVPAPILHDLLAATYRSGRARVAARAGELDGLVLTQASDLVVFVRRELRSPAGPRCDHQKPLPSVR